MNCDIDILTICSSYSYYKVHCVPYTSSFSMYVACARGETQDIISPQF